MAAERARRSGLPVQSARSYAGRRHAPATHARSVGTSGSSRSLRSRALLQRGCRRRQQRPFARGPVGRQTLARFTSQMAAQTVPWEMPLIWDIVVVVVVLHLGAFVRPRAAARLRLCHS